MATSSPSLVDRPLIEELLRVLADLLPQAAENPRRLLELRRRHLVLVDGVEQEAAQADRRLEDGVAHPDLGQISFERPQHDVGHHRPDPLGRARAEDVGALARQVLRPQQPRAHGIVDVVVDVGDDVGDAGDLPLDRAGAVRRVGADRDAVLPFRVPGDPVAHFPREVQPLPVVLEDVDDAEALLVVLEPAGHQRLQDAFAGVSERRVPEIVAERDRLGQLFVQPKHLGDAARDLRDLERVRQARAVVIALRARRRPASCASAGGRPSSG